MSHRVHIARAGHCESHAGHKPGISHIFPVRLHCSRLPPQTGRFSAIMFRDRCGHMGFNTASGHPFRWRRSVAQWHFQRQGRHHRQKAAASRIYPQSPFSRGVPVGDDAKRVILDAVPAVVSMAIIRELLLGRTIRHLRRRGYLRIGSNQNNAAFAQSRGPKASHCLLTYISGADTWPFSLVVGRVNRRPPWDDV